MPPLGAPPMSAPHLDTRVINGKPWLLFGPFAGWSPKFLKQGQHHRSARSRSSRTTWCRCSASALTELGLVKYLIGQLAAVAKPIGSRHCANSRPAQSIPTGSSTAAGQRVQVIRRAKGKGGVLEFGTTVLSAADGTIAGLLGASPGASTAVPAMLDVLERCFGDRYRSWQPKLKEMVPSLGTELSTNRRCSTRSGSWGTEVLKLDKPADGVATAPLRWSPAPTSSRRLQNDGRATPQLGQGSRRRDAVRIAQVAGRGVRGRTGLPVPRAGRPRPARRNHGTSGSKAPTAKSSDAAADGGTPRRSRRASASAGCAPNAAPAVTAIPTG